MAGKVTQRVCNGSGYMFVRKANNDTHPVPTQADWNKLEENEKVELHTFLKELCTDDNELGFLKGGYTFNDTITPVTDQSDMGQIVINSIQDENAENTFALFNGNGETIAKLHPMAQTASAADGTRVTNLGGISNKDESEYDICFVHPDSAEGDFIIFTRGKNVSGLTLDFKPDSVTPMPCNYKAQSLDKSGHLCKIVELPVGFEWNNSYTGESQG